MVEVYINYSGVSEKLTDEPVGMMTAYGIIEDTHAETTKDLNTILDAFCLRGLRGQILDRMNNGDDYDIVSAETGEILRKVHCSF